MRITIVSQRNGVRRVHWLNYTLLSLVLAAVVGGGMGGIFLLLAGRVGHGPILFGIGIGVGMVAMELIRGLATPVDKLPGTARLEE